MLYFPLTAKNLMLHLNESNSETLERIGKCGSRETSSSFMLSASKNSNLVDESNAEFDSHHQISPTKHLSSAECLDSITSVYSSARSITSKFENLDSNFPDSAELLHHNNTNLDIENRREGYNSLMSRTLPIMHSSFITQGRRTAWNSTMAWRILYRMIQKKILAELVEADSLCPSDISAPKLSLHIAVADDCREKQINESDQSTSSQIYPAFVGTEVAKQTTLIGTRSRFIDDNEGRWSKGKNTYLGSSSFSNSFHLLSAAATAANAGLKQLKSVLKVSKLNGQLANRYLPGSTGEEMLPQKQTSVVVEREDNVNVRGNLEHKAKSKMHWYFRNEFHRICLTLVNQV